MNKNNDYGEIIVEDSIESSNILTTVVLIFFGVMFFGFGVYTFFNFSFPRLITIWLLTIGAILIFIGFIIFKRKIEYWSVCENAIVKTTYVNKIKDSEFALMFVYDFIISLSEHEHTLKVNSIHSTIVIPSMNKSEEIKKAIIEHTITSHNQNNSERKEKVA